MKLRSYSLLILAATAAAALSSCKKEEDAPTRAQMMVGTWKTTQVGVDSNANGTWEASEQRPAAGAVEDVTLTFNGDGTGTANYAVFGSPFAITWSLQNGDQDLRIISNVFGADTTDVNIVSFASTEAIVRDLSESPVRYMTLRKQ